jgi:hypothetical protein
MTILPMCASHALRPALTPRMALRGASAATAWGLLFAAGLSVMQFSQYGVICAGDIATTTGLSIVAGLLTIGPLAAFAAGNQNSRA